MSQALTTTGECTKLLQKYGYKPGDPWNYQVERFVAYSNRRYDYGGFADLLAFRPVDKIPPDLLAKLADPDCPTPTLSGVLAIQTCSYDKLSDHFDHILFANPAPNVRDWLRAGNRFELWGWHHLKRGGRRRRFMVPLAITWSAGHFCYQHASELSLWGWTSDPQALPPLRFR